MGTKVLKFGSTDSKKFIKIYRNYECLWNTGDIDYNNRDARNTALEKFAKEFGVEGFGPKEITNKIKNLRTQYNGERKKIKDSVVTGSGITDVYKPKLSWYDLMDSFLRTTYEHKEPNTQVYEDEYNLPKLTKNTIKKRPFNYIQPAFNKLDNNEKRARLEETNEELDNFGKYVASSLRKLNTKNSIHAQDEIQAVLSKYKLQDLKNEDRQKSTRMLH